MELAAALTEIAPVVQAELATLCARHGVAVPLAVESGSRAWGFPSPDSDFDVRFLFVRPVVQHLTPWPARDVIETPVTPELELNGWELGKALKLMLKGNAVVVEWLRSPFAYVSEPGLREALTAFARRWVRREAVASHYLHLGLRQHGAYLAGRETVRLKKLFYGLRPAAALRWLRAHPGEAVAPMHLPSLLDEAAPPPEVDRAIRELIARKAVTRELGEAAAPALLLRFMEAEFEAAPGWMGKAEPQPGEAFAAAVALYRAQVERVG